MKTHGVKIWGAKGEFATQAAAKNAASSAAKSGDELYNLTMAVNGKGTHAWQTHAEVYRRISKAGDADDLHDVLSEIGRTFADKGTLLDPKTMKPF